MAIRNRLRRFEASSRSWKTSAQVNTILVAVLAAVLLAALFYGLVVNRDLGVNSTFALFQGSCQTASGLNILVHLVLNVFGTLILASSNFFMQLVAAPSRAELDRAHQKWRWIDIGIPTVRNFASLSGFKRASWLVLMASSVPIHLLFNSVIFYVESQRATFTMTLAAQPFVQGATYYPPGAGLWNMNVPQNCTEPANLEISTRCSRTVPEPYGLWDVNGSLVTCAVFDSPARSNRSCPDYLLEQKLRNNPSDPPWTCLSEGEFYDPTVCYRGGVADRPSAGEPKPPSFDPVNRGRRINCTQPATTADAKTCIQQVWTPAWEPVNDRTKEDYLNPSSPANIGIRRAATAVQRKWERLDYDACRREYRECGQGRGLRSYGDVVVVLQDILPTTAKVEDLKGWTRKQLFPGMSASDAAFWDDLVPANALNPLLYSAECTMKQSFTKASDGSNQCRNSCGAALGFGLLADGGTKVGAESRPATNPQGYWSISFWRPTDAWKVQMRSGIGSGLYNHQDRVAYCLAEVLDADSDENACIIGVSNIVLLVVTLCVLAKTAQSLLVTRKLVWRPNPEPPVVTLGDAIDSFLRRPERTASKMCTLEQSDFARPWWSLPWSKPPAVVPPSGPRPWKSSGSRRASALPLPSRVLTATLFISVLVASLTFFGFALRTAKRIEPFGVASQSFILLGRSGSSSSSSSYSGNLIAYIILSNIPQLVISICHLRLNAVLTRLCVAKEWHEMSIAYRPLRTTEPKGEQTGRYTLQMPLAWAVPSILLSMVLHFLVASSLYVFVSKGGYLTSDAVGEEEGSGQFVGLGYSTSAMLCAILLFAVMMLVPVWLARGYLPGDGPDTGGRSVLVGTNSLAVAAACHPSSLSKALVPGQEEGAGCQSPGADADEEGSLWEGEKRGKGVGDCLAESRIRWGVVRMPEGFHEGNLGMAISGGEGVGHLSFGMREDGVEAPVKGRWYV